MSYGFWGIWCRTLPHDEARPGAWLGKPHGEPFGGTHATILEMCSMLGERRGTEVVWYGRDFSYTPREIES